MAGKHNSQKGRYKRKVTRSSLPLILAMLLLGVVSLGLFLNRSDFVAVIGITRVEATPEPSAVPTAAPTPTPAPTPLVETVRFSATGDNLIHGPIYRQAAARAAEGQVYDFSYAYENMASFYANYDVNWLNQETLVNDKLEPSTYPCFSTPGECAKALYDIGIRVFALSNNHTYDKGKSGISATLDFWNSMPSDVVTTGLWGGESDYDRIPLQEVNGIKIAYLAYTETTNGIPTPSGAQANVIYTSQHDVMQRQIQLAREIADIVVVGMHWGVEYSHNANDYQKTLAQQLADWGADLIIGTHPHVLQDAQWLTSADGRDVFVAYSLGNFISTQDRTPRAIGAILTVAFEKVTELDGSISITLIDPKLHPVVTHYDAGRQNVRTYLYRDYTPELAAKHGMNNYDSSFSYEKILEVVQSSISEQFIDLN